MSKELVIIHYCGSLIFLAIFLIPVSRGYSGKQNFLQMSVFIATAMAVYFSWLDNLLFGFLLAAGYTVSIMGICKIGILSDDIKKIDILLKEEFVFCASCGKSFYISKRIALPEHESYDGKRCNSSGLKKALPFEKYRELEIQRMISLGFINN